MQAQENLEQDKINFIPQENLSRANKNLFKVTNKDKKSASGEQQLLASNHKLLHYEVPDWNNFTKDEAFKILVKHVCYFNHERK
jgi:hypothetical protein